jgi:tousled-like kinase
MSSPSHGAAEAAASAARKLRLLEARLNPTASSPAPSSQSADTEAAASPLPPPPVMLQRPPPAPRAQAGGDGDEDDDVASFSTDGSSQASRGAVARPGRPARAESLGLQAAVRSRSMSRDRSYAPQVDGTLDSFVGVVTPAAAAAGEGGAAKRVTPAKKSGRTPAAPAKKHLRRKRGRVAAGLGSPAAGGGAGGGGGTGGGAAPPMKTMKVDEYFKPSSAPKALAAKAVPGQMCAAGVRRELAFQSPSQTLRPANGTPAQAPALPLPLPQRPRPASPMEATKGGKAGLEGGSAALRPGDAYAHMRALIGTLRADLVTAEERAACAAADAAALGVENEDLRAQLEEIPALQARADRGDEATKALTVALAKSGRMRTQLRYALTESAVARRAEARREAAAGSERLGRIATERNGTAFADVWEDGVALRENRDRLRQIQADRERLERKRRELAKLKRAMPPPPPPGTPYENTPEYAAEVDEVLKLRAAALRREEAQLMEDRAKMVMERDCLLRELGRQSDEGSSAFGNFPVLNERYLLLNLLGRGGFSEVFRAYDFESARFVACKVHQLASNWSEARKQSFLRHMLRENEIHSSLSHPRILRAHDSFELDKLTVVSVLDLCNGTDLDVVLRKNGALPEREARSIIAQVFAGLVYLDRHDIVHYDLKPGNILLDNGQVRITDFGLSKINTESAPDGMMDLTSQGAGTMWYLPPECFASKGAGGPGPRISAKVDVWSAAVILFQCLFGCKPFGHGQSQEQFFRENTASKEALQFPPRPAVSDAAKDFIRACLTRDVVDRPDVRAASEHPFLLAGRK